MTKRYYERLTLAERARLYVTASDAHQREVVAAARAGITKPRTRGECVDGIRPCPWASCRHHLAVEVVYKMVTERRGWMDDDIDTCSLDVADRGSHTLKTVGELMPGTGARLLTRERVRQIEEVALAKMRGQ